MYGVYSTNYVGRYLQVPVNTMDVCRLWLDKFQLSRRVRCKVQHGL